MPQESVDFFRSCFRDRDRRVAGSKIYRAMVGISYGYDQPGWEPSARRLIGVFMAGLKAPGQG